MGATQLLILLISTADQTSARSQSLLQTLRGELQLNVALEAPDEEAAREPGAAQAQVSWSADGERAGLSLKGADGKLRDQTLDFSPQDPPEDRGRAAAFALAAMIDPGTNSPLPSVAARRPDPPAGLKASIQVGAQGGVGSPGLGFSVGARLQGASGWFAQLRGALRVGPVREFQTTSVLTALGVGRTVVGLGPVKLGVNLDALALLESVEREGPSEERHSRWLPGVDLLAELELPLFERMEVFFEAGPELALGTTTLSVNGVKLESIPPLRGIADAGLRLRF